MNPEEFVKQLVETMQDEHTKNAVLKAGVWPTDENKREATDAVTGPQIDEPQVTVSVDFRFVSRLFVLTANELNGILGGRDYTSRLSCQGELAIGGSDRADNSLAVLQADIQRTRRGDRHHAIPRNGDRAGGLGFQDQILVVALEQAAS